MTGVVVTSTTNAIKVVFNDFASGQIGQKGTWLKREVRNIILTTDGSLVLIRTEDNQQWSLAYTATTGALTIDTVDGVAPTSNSDLYNKLSALIE